MSRRNRLRSQAQRRRRNPYQIRAHMPLPEPASQEPVIGEVIALLTGAALARGRRFGLRLTSVICSLAAAAGSGRSIRVPPAAPGVRSHIRS